MMSIRPMRRSLSIVMALLAVLVLNAPVRAQAPDQDYAIYTNSCMNKESGDTWGEGVTLTRSATGYRFEFIDATSVPHAPVPINGQISGDKIGFEFQLGELHVRFAGSITPNEIRGRYTNDRNISFYNTEKVLLERVLPGQTLGYCPSAGWRRD